MPQLTHRMVEKIFATDFEDWPAVLRAMHETGDEFRRGEIASPAEGGATPGKDGRRAISRHGSACRCAVVGMRERNLITRKPMARRRYLFRRFGCLQVSLLGPRSGCRRRIRIRGRTSTWSSIWCS